VFPAICASSAPSRCASSLRSASVKNAPISISRPCERSNNRLYVSLIDSQPTVYSDEKILPSLPASVLNVMQSGRATNHEFVSSPESAHEETSVPFDVVVTGSYSLKIFVN